MSDQPITFGSKWEENFYAAMVQRKRTFEYQVPYFGGWNARGGTVVDFLDESPGLPRPVAIYVDGPHWHRNKTGKKLEDMLKRKRLESIGLDVKAIEDESETFEGCLKWIKENLG